MEEEERVEREGEVEDGTEEERGGEGVEEWGGEGVEEKEGVRCGKGERYSSSKLFAVLSLFCGCCGCWVEIGLKRK